MEKDEELIVLGPNRHLAKRALELAQARLDAKRVGDPDAYLTPEDFAELKAQYMAETHASTGDDEKAKGETNITEKTGSADLTG